MSNICCQVILDNLRELKQIMSPANGKLIRSKISPDDYFVNLSHDAPTLKYTDFGISKVAVNVCELVSTLLLEDIDESNSVSKVIIMIFEYYFLVAPLKFKDQGPRLINDYIFMRQFMRYISSLFKSRAQAQRELQNTIVAVDFYNPLKDNDST